MRVWGVSPQRLHDLLWASRCVRVVRTGDGCASVRKGPALYLLLDEHQVVHLPLDEVLKRMHWAAPRLVRLRINVREENDYAESVLDGPEGIRFVRSYGKPVARITRAWLTSDLSVARAWADAAGPREGRRAVRAMVKRESLISVAVEGFSADSDTRTLSDWLRLAQDQWKRPNAVIPWVYEYQPGVWVHESASIGPGVRIHGPAWIGAGVELGGSEVVVGPVLFDDASRTEESPSVERVDWDLTRSPHWNMPSLASGGGVARRFWKRLFDIGFSLAVLVGTFPLYPIVMLAIWLEDGRPFFFAHKRQTLGGREFPCLKFRTMRKDAEEIKKRLQTVNAADGPQFFMENDPRVTRTGRLLRKCQIDELPQFLNVLAGHMSVVGPRPSPDKENQFCPAWREARLSVRPGVTGLWQVSRTRLPQTDFQEWIRYDLEYVQHQSFGGDLRIIFETVRHLIPGQEKPGAGSKTR